MKKEITRIIRQYPKTDDCKFQTLGELWNWQETQIMDLIKNEELKELLDFILCKATFQNSKNPKVKDNVICLALKVRDRIK